MYGLIARDENGEIVYHERLKTKQLAEKRINEMRRHHRQWRFSILEPKGEQYEYTCDRCGKEAEWHDSDTDEDLCEGCACDSVIEMIKDNFSVDELIKKFMLEDFERIAGILLSR